MQTVLRNFVSSTWNKDKRVRVPNCCIKKYLGHVFEGILSVCVLKKEKKYHKSFLFKAFFLFAKALLSETDVNCRSMVYQLTIKRLNWPVFKKNSTSEIHNFKMKIKHFFTNVISVMGQLKFHNVEMSCFKLSDSIES